MPPIKSRYFNEKAKKPQVADNPYNPQHKLYKDLTRLLSGGLANYKTPHPLLNKRKDLNKYKFFSAGGLPFKKSSSSSPIDYLYTRSVAQMGRLERYMEFETIDLSSPEVSSALDIYASEITAYSEFSPMVKILTNNDEIKDNLNHLFYNILNVHDNLFSWVRSLCKMGDLFIYFNIEEKIGITSFIGFRPSEIERMEGLDEKNPNYVRFQWNSGGQAFENWQVAHFRILGDDKYLPYGISVLNGIRRIWRQLDLMENYVIGYRMVRSSERRVFYIDVASIAPEDVESYINKIISNIKENTIIDTETGRADRRYNPTFPISKNSIIPLLDGRNITIEELAKEYDSGKTNWVHSIHDKQHNLLPGKVVWCGKNYTANKLIRVVLDDDTYIDSAPEHPFILRDGTKVRADELKENDSLMPFYREQEKYSNQNKKQYYKVYDPKEGKYIFTHRFVANDVLSKEKEIKKQDIKNEGDFLVIHHKGTKEKPFDALNNDPSLLEWMTNKEHSEYHAQIGKQNIIKWNKSEAHSKASKERYPSLNLKKYIIDYNNSDLHKEHNKIRSELKKDFWKGDTTKTRQKMSFNFNEDVLNYIQDIIKNSDSYISVEKLCDILTNDKYFNDLILKLNNNVKKFTSVHRAKIRSIIQKYGFSDYRDFYKKIKPDMEFPGGGRVINHKVKKLEILEKQEDVYCMTVEGPNGEQDRHNFAVLTHCNDGTISKSGLLITNSIEKDFYLPVRGKDSPTKIDTLQSGQLVDAIDDIKYFKDKLFSGLKIPGAYLAQSDTVDDKMSLAQKDLMFGKTIMRIQNSIVAELKKIATIHLWAIGFRGKDLLDFDIKLNNPSKIAEMQELEHLRLRSEVASSLAEGFFSKEYIYKKIFGMSDIEIQEQISGLFSDIKREILMQQLSEMNTSDGGGPAGGGMPSDDFASAGISEPEDSTGPTSDTLMASPSADEIEQLKADVGGESGSDIETKTGNEAKRNETYMSPNANGKAYTKVGHDSRQSSVPRVKQLKSKYNQMASSNNYRNVFQGAMGLKSLSMGIIPENNKQDDEVNDILKTMTLINENKSIIIKNNIQNSFVKYLEDNYTPKKEDGNEDE